MLTDASIDVLAGLRRRLGEPATLRETHASSVLVGPREAIKIKKPVVLPFLDYGTPALRRAACEAEVRLNRRLAPGVYLRAAAVVPSGEGVELAPTDDPRAIEYAVVMRRYEESDTLASRLAAGAVTAADAERVGARLAAFHGDAERVEAPGGAEPIKRWLDDTHASLRALLPPLQAARFVAHSERFTAAFLAARWAELDRRAAEGRVRDGHGDLRAEHVLLQGSRILVVDCVEFDPALRRIDVASDLAFLVMDFERAGARALGDRLVAAYRAAGGDPGDDALLSWLAAYRAQVRGKVALLRAGQPGDAADASSRREALGYLRTGERLLWRARGPLVIAVGGLAAAGKTTLAAELADRAGLPRVSSDVIRKAGAGLAPTARAPETLYSATVSHEVYAELGRQAAAAGGAVVDATFRSAAERSAFRDALGVARRTLFVECTTPADVRLARAAARETDPRRVSDAGPAVVRAQVMEPMDEVPPAAHVLVRGDDLLVAQVEAVADALDRSPLLSR